MALYIESYSTNELLLGKMLFELQAKTDEKRLKNFVVRMAQRGSIVSVLRFVASYLLTIMEPNKAKEILRKYTVCVVYLSLKKKKLLPEKEYIIELDQLYDGISLCKLEQELNYDDKVFAGIYRCDVKDFSKHVDKLRVELELNNMYTKEGKKLLFALYNIYDYFQLKTDFTQYNDNRQSCDLIVAEANASTNTRDFTIDISDEEITKNMRLYNVDEEGNRKEDTETFVKKELPQMIRNAKILVGHLVNDILINKKDIRSVKTISSSVLACYSLQDSAKISSGQSKSSYINFLSYYNEDYYLNLEKIIEFEFYFNGLKYSFTKDGVK